MQFACTMYIVQGAGDISALNGVFKIADDPRRKLLGYINAESFIGKTLS